MKKNSTLKLTLIVLAGIISLFIMGLCIVNGSKNEAISLEENVSATYSDVKVQEKRRTDLITNLVDCVKEYDKHEYKTLTDIIDKRNTENISDKDMENISNKINVVVEAYPNLKSNTNYKELMNELSVTENLIAQHRITYNKAIKSYKRYCRKFPTNTFLSITNYEIVNFDYLSYDVSEDAPTNLFED